MARCLRAFPSVTAPGPTGLRVQQLKDACVAGGTEAFLAQLAAVVQLLAHGRAPACVSSVLGGAGLVALRKPTGGVRPIAVGEISAGSRASASYPLSGKMHVSCFRQCKLVLVWACGGFSRIVHSMRCNPPHSESIALDMFDGITRHCLAT